MKFRSEVSQLRDIQSGETVGYEAWFQAKQKTRVAIVPVGYADGYPRTMGGKASALIRGVRCPVIGAVSMDITAIDVTSLGSSVARGDEVVLLGRQMGDQITLAEFANWSGRTEYEAMCGISKRVPRVAV